MRKTLSLLFVFFLLLSPAAKAEEPTSESLDWLTITRPSIAVAAISGTAPINNVGSNNSQIAIQAHITLVLKGHPPAEANFVRRWQAGATPGQNDTARPENGTEYMLFFNDRGDVTNAINLLYPSRKLGVGADSRDVAIGPDFTVLKSRELILDLVQQTLEGIPAATAPNNTYLTKPKKVEVPMASAAWDALYESGECFLLVPDESQRPNHAAQRAPTLTQRIDFDGGAFANECSNLPRKPFLIAGSGKALAQHMTFRCNPYVNSGYKDMTQIELELQLVNALRNADYEFTLDVDPVMPGSQKPYFGSNRQQCELMSKIFSARLPHRLKFRAEGDPETAPPMSATWKVDCRVSDRWGFILLFQVALRPNGAEDNEFAEVKAQPTPLPTADSSGATPGGSKAVIAAPAAVPPGPVAQSPLSAAMAAPSISTTILTAAPVVANIANDAKPQPVLNQAIDFNGVASVGDCQRLPVEPYELFSVGSRGSQQQLTIKCGGPATAGDQDKITMTYQLLDAPRNADYDFTLEFDPAATYRKPMFGEDRQKCEYTAHMLSVHIPPQLRFAAAGDPPHSQPMNAAWRVDCVAGMSGYTLAFKMALRPPGSLVPSAKPDAAPSSSLPLATSVVPTMPPSAIPTPVGATPTVVPAASLSPTAFPPAATSFTAPAPSTTVLNANVALAPTATPLVAVPPAAPKPIAPKISPPSVSDLPFLTQAASAPHTDGANPPAQVSPPAETVRALPPLAAPKALPPMVGAPPQ